jgi:DNA-binding MarR family transcriptional regulator/N-acetylglutamate synthase-like GNAT family acetyltransferase
MAADYALLDKSKYVGRACAVSNVEAVRRFNRFYTGRIGILPEDYLGSSYSLAEARVLFELGRNRESGATQLGRDLGLDLGYLSRLLHGLKRRGLVQGRTAAGDARRSVLTLTANGQRAYQALDARSREEVGGLLAQLPKSAQASLVGAMGKVERLLRNERSPIELRAPRPGDIGWVVQAHGRLYSEEYGFDGRFEALVADIAAKFLRSFDAARERCWIAEMDGEPVGSVFLVSQGKTTAKLRLLLIEPKARGVGLGKRLVGECIAFARARGYRKVVLWTQSNLAAARHIYANEGFRLARRRKHREFGYDLTGEFWELRL